MESMKKRVISAIFVVLICAPFIYFGGIPFYIFGIVISLMGYRELLNLLIKKSIFIRFVGYLSFLCMIGNNLYKTQFMNILDYRMIGLIFLLFCLAGLLSHKKEEFKISKLFAVMGITFLLAFTTSTLFIVRNISIRYLLFLLSIPVFNDTFAHSIGTLFGKHKINEISPNKSWEGCLGGLFFGVLGSSILYLILINTEINIIILMLIVLCLSIIGQLGDLFFSLIKRQYGVKDFGTVIPGHGGILDRLDSFIFVLLAFTFLTAFL